MQHNQYIITQFSILINYKVNKNNLKTNFRSKLQNFPCQRYNVIEVNIKY